MVNTDKEVSKTDTERERFYTISDAAQLLKVSDQSIRRWIKAGELKAFKPKKEYRIAESDLQEFLEGRAVPLVQAPLKSSLNDVLEEERGAAVIPWGAYTRQIAARIQGHADDPESPAFRDPWAALFFVEEANHSAADVGIFLDEQLSGALEVADVEAMHELMDAFQELSRAIGAADARARMMEAGRTHSELGQARRRAEEATAERERVTAELSAHSGRSA